jgi:glycosyltransferase involved in cell wall biosynthesis
MVCETKNDNRGKFDIIKSKDLLEKPVISIVMSVFNGGNFLAEAIESIQNQSYKNFEFIIINDGSGDNSLDIIKKYQEEDSRIIILNQNNMGLTKSLNRGIEQSRGKYIARQDADDISYLDRFEKQIEFVESKKNCMVCSSNYEVINNLGEIISSRIQSTKKFIWIYFLLGNQVAHGTALIDKKLFEKIGYYDESLCCSQDYDLWMRALNYNKYCISFVDSILYKYRDHESNISNTKTLKQKEIAKVIKFRFIKTSF